MIIYYCGNKWERWWNCGLQNRHYQHQTGDLLEIYLVRHHPRHTNLETPVVGSALGRLLGDSDLLSSFKQVVLKPLSEQWFGIYFILNGSSTSQEFIDRIFSITKVIYFNSLMSKWDNDLRMSFKSHESSKI